MYILPIFKHVDMTDSFLVYFLIPFIERRTPHCPLPLCMVLAAIVGRIPNRLQATSVPFGVTVCIESAVRGLS